MAAWLLMECGVWPYRTPLMEMPPDFSEEVIGLLTRQVPWRLSVMHQTLRVMKALAAHMGAEVE